jgi:CPA2 family monovalent cation:H+ antiporter-2
MHHVDLIFTLTLALTAALALGYITQRLGLSPIVGYLMAGILLSPHTPGFVADQALAEQLAEIGVILLMFGVGLHFHLEELLSVRRIAIPGAVAQSVLATALGLVVAIVFGWTWQSGLVFGLAISVASTVVLIRVLSDNRDLHTPSGRIAVGWLIVEDIFTVMVLVVLPELFGDREAGPARVPLALGLATVKIGVLVAFTLLVGRRVVPWLLERVAVTRSRELFTLTVLVVALGTAVASAKVFGVSMALGAFLGGMIVGRSEFSLRAATEALPMRDAFAVLFFVSVGMLFEPSILTTMPLLIIATCAVIFVGKPFAALVITLVMGYPFKVALGVSVALAQIGEFSFILAHLGQQLGVLNEAAGGVLVAAAIVSITMNPLVYKTVAPIDRWVMHQPWARAWLLGNRRTVEGIGDRAVDEAAHKAIVIGYGPVGRTLTRLLRENGIEPTVIELNLNTIRQLREAGIPAVYGDASHRDTLTSAGVREAASLILSSAGMREGQEIIRLARELNPHIRVLARANYVVELADLRRAGAASAFSGEGEVALALIEAVLRPLGATAEQIDRERDRFRAEVLGAAPNSPLPERAPVPTSEPQTPVAPL